MEKNAKITQIVVQNDPGRVSTGAVQFNDDWPGLFIRGDEAFALMLELKQILQTLGENDESGYSAYVIKKIIDVIEQDVILHPES